MNNIVKLCAILHTMIVEFRDAHGSMRTMNIVSIDLNAKATRLRLHVKPSNSTAKTIHLQGDADRIDDCHDHDNLTSVTVTVIEFSESSSRVFAGIVGF